MSLMRNICYSFLGWMSKAFKSFFKAQMSALNGQLFLDYSADLNADAMSDANHLNKAGASLYTKQLISVLYIDSVNFK
jgi:hypothetical protein